MRFTPQDDSEPGTCTRDSGAESGHADRARLRVDLHAHTRRSLDATTAPADLVERALETGLDRIAVTDHGEIEGAFEARELASDLVIVGQEVRCRCRTELIGLFLSERIPDRLPLEEVVERIRDQGGAIYAPHPFAYAWASRRRAARTLEVADVVEAFNGRAFLGRWNRLARHAARQRGLPQGAGSDAHFPSEIGRAWTELPPFRTASEFLEVASEARAVGRTTTGPTPHLVSVSLKAARLVTGELPSLRWQPGEAATLSAER